MSVTLENAVSHAKKYALDGFGVNGIEFGQVDGGGDFARILWADCGIDAADFGVEFWVFVCEPEVFDYIDGDSSVFEKDPLEKLAANKELSAFKHYGFWQCMDTKRDRDSLNEMIKKDNAPWMK